jgi:hypothetical protein
MEQWSSGVVEQWNVGIVPACPAHGRDRLPAGRQGVGRQGILGYNEQNNWDKA